jgi:hypothetical protein
MDISLEQRIEAFSKLGDLLDNVVNDTDSQSKAIQDIEKIIGESPIHNPWFIPENVKLAVRAIAGILSEDKLKIWLKPYQHQLLKYNKSFKIAVVMAGNIPLVGFHDFLCVLMAGHKIICKLSSDDDKLLPAIIRLLTEIEPKFGSYIEIAEDKLFGFDAVIATGSNNTSRYFEYYFGKYPHIIRRNRNGVAILTGEETTDQLDRLGTDIFSYFGMGCRSISKVFVPKGYRFDNFFESIDRYQMVINNFKYNNNYDYYKSIYLVNRVQHLDNGFLLVKEDTSYSSPPSVLFFEHYDKMEELIRKLETDFDLIQCVVGQTGKISGEVPFGKAQQPELWDYADGVDTMDFLLELKGKNNKL